MKNLMEVTKMKRLTIICISFIIVSLMFAGQIYAKVNPDTVLGAWLLDEGKGDITADASGNGNDGTLMGGPNWVAGWSGNALEFAGSSTYVDCGNAEALNVEVFSVSFWCNIPSTQGWNHIISRGQHGASGSPGSVNWGVMMYDAQETILFETYNDTAWTGITASTTTGEWHHIVATYDGDTMQLYHDGELASNVSGIGILLDESRRFLIGARSDAGSAGGFFNGSIDEVGYFNVILAPEDIETIMNNGLAGITRQPLARRPDPKDGGMHKDTWVTLSWSAGDFAVSHDVYLGDDFGDVNDGTRESEVFRGNEGSPYFVAGFIGYPYPDGLVPGTTYYWRIDEVNDANAGSPWKGNVWSFTVPSKKAYEPAPADGSSYIDAESVILSWTKGFGAILNTVYFGDDFDTVANATGGPPLASASYDPGTLEAGKSYFWRVDEFDGTATHKGDVWSFKTMPYLPITDPNLVGLWKFDEGSDVTVLDSSGHGNHGTLKGNPQWVIGHDGDALEFDGVDDWVNVPHAANLTVDNEVTVMAWINAERHSGPGTEEWQGIIAKSNSPRSYSLYTYSPGTLHFSTADVGTTSSEQVPLNEWVHVCAMVTGGQHQYYINGEDAGSGGSGVVLPGTADTSNVFIGRSQEGATRSFLGMIDDARIYNKALTQDEIKQIMRGDTTLAWGPSPAHRSTPDLDRATPLSWSPGEKAAEHDVYFGTDKDAVDDADTTTTDIYRGRLATTSYTPPEGVEWGGGPYYWRIDEYNTDGTLSKGQLWSFTVADFILVDDFEDYDAGDNQIWYAWHDGLGYGTPGTADYFAGNGTGSAVGDENTASYTEETITHSSGKSMPLVYDNNQQFFANYSETELTLTALRDWTEQDVSELSLWFRGYPASTGSFVEGPVGTYTMTASGTDIWLVNNVEADEFHFAYKMLTGAGSIIARVGSVENTNDWAKAGVMIRETLDPDSAHAFACVTPVNGVAFQFRPSTGGTSESANQSGITAPYWVKLERSISGRFTVSHSANGSNWLPVTGATSQTISMGANVYIGLALTSHDPALTCQAVFSNVTTTGTVSPQWANQDVGIASNDAEPLYIAVSNSAGAPAVVVHDDPDAAQIGAWTEWVIPLQTLADQGIVLTNVDRIAIGLGTRGNMTVPGGSGKMFFDDIRLYRPRETAE